MKILEKVDSLHNGEPEVSFTVDVLEPATLALQICFVYFFPVFERKNENAGVKCF